MARNATLPLRENPTTFCNMEVAGPTYISVWANCKGYKMIAVVTALGVDTQSTQFYAYDAATSELVGIGTGMHPSNCLAGTVPTPFPDVCFDGYPMPIFCPWGDAGAPRAD